MMDDQNRPSSASIRSKERRIAASLFFEKIIFTHRRTVLAFFFIASIFLLWQATQLQSDARFQKMVPASHPFIVNYLKYESELRPMGNLLRIAVENTQGDIYTRQFLETLKQVTDEVFYIPGIDRGNLRSLWTPNTLWLEAMEDGLHSGPIMPSDLNSSEQINEVRAHVAKMGLLGNLVANDQRSALVIAPLLEIDPDTRKNLDYGLLSERLERLLRDKFEKANIKIHISGPAKVVGDLIAGTRAMVSFFLITFISTALLLYLYSRCWRSTLATIFCCSLAVIWQLGLVRLLGFGLDPYSILVPFLTFAIGVSHAVQNINTMASERFAGATNVAAARRTFALLFIPGSIALLCDVVGFSSLLVIDIGVIRELAISAGIGVAVIIFTKMFLLPVLMSFVGVSDACLRDQERKSKSRHRVARAIAALSEKGNARVALIATALLFAFGYYHSRDVKVGDLDPGAPELRADSRYNRDNAYLTKNYSASADVFVVMVKTLPGECGSYPVASAVERLQWALENTTGVQSTVSLFNWMKKTISGANGGNLKWATITRNRFISNSAHRTIPTSLYNTDCSMLPIVAYLDDHKAETLSTVVRAVEKFAEENKEPDITFTLAAGNAGIEAATNAVITRAEKLMLVLVYGIVAILVLWEFRSWQVMFCLMVPLYITSVLAEAIMAGLGLGIKVATLPIIALGVGIGVDYGIYLYNRLEQFLSRGLPLQAAYFETLKTTGTAIVFTGVTLAMGVSTWVFSAIKFQADMGLLLMFIFIWNMVGTIILVPVIAGISAQRQTAGAR